MSATPALTLNTTLELMSISNPAHVHQALSFNAPSNKAPSTPLCTTVYYTPSIA